MVAWLKEGLTAAAGTISVGNPGIAGSVMVGEIGRERGDSAAAMSAVPSSIEARVKATVAARSRR